MFHNANSMQKRAIFRVFPQNSPPAGGNRPADETNNEHQAKRLKLGHESGVEPTEYARKKPGPLRTYKPVTRATAQRWSSRTPAKRQVFGAASPEQLEQLEDDLRSLSDDDDSGVDDQSAGEEDSAAQRRLMVKFNTKPSAVSDSARDPMTETSESQGPGSLGEALQEASSTQSKEAQATQRQRDLLPSSTSKKQTKVASTPDQPQPETLTTPSRPAVDTSAMQPREERRTCVSPLLSATVPVQDGSLSSAPPPPRAPSATTLAGQTLPIPETVTAPTQEPPAKESQELGDSVMSPSGDHTQTPLRNISGSQDEAPEQASSMPRGGTAQQASSMLPPPGHAEAPPRNSRAPSQEFGTTRRNASGQENSPKKTPQHETPRPSTEHIHARYGSVLDEEFGGNDADMERIITRSGDTKVQDEQRESPSESPDSPVAAPQVDRKTPPSVEEPTAPLLGNMARGWRVESFADHMPWPTFTRAMTEFPSSRQENFQVSREDPRRATVKHDTSAMPSPTFHTVNTASPDLSTEAQGRTKSPSIPALGAHTDVAVSNSERTKDNSLNLEQERLPKQETVTQKQTPGKPNIRVLYSVILSREPVLQCHDWKPNGAFRDKTWSQLREEIPLTLGANTKGLRFKLTGPGLSTESRVQHGEDEEFEVVKRRFERMIRACVPKGVAGGEPPIFEMEMEAFTDESPEAGEMYEEDFAW